MKLQSINSLYRVAFFLALCGLSTIDGEVSHPNLIEKISVKGNKLTITPHSRFKKQYLKDTFFAEYETDINLEQFEYSVLSLPFIMNVISIVWISGDTYVVDEMDGELYESLKRIKRVFQTMYPRTSWDGELIPLTLVDSTTQSHATPLTPSVVEGVIATSDENKTHCLPTPLAPTCPVHSLSEGGYREATDTREKTALLFSGGLDSTSTALAHLDKKQLLITAWGHWDLPLNEPALWQVRKKKITQFAEQFGNEVSSIKSNYQSFLNWEYLSNLTPEIKKWRLGAVEGLGWAGLCAPILLSKGYPTLRIASSHTWLYPYPSAASPFIDNNIHLHGLQVIHDQFNKTRLQKIAFVCDGYKHHAVEKPFLKICSVEKKFDSNCCNCRKCISTAIGFYALNKIPKTYGLPLSLEQAVKKTLELLAPQKLNYYTILYFREVQEALKQRIAKGEKLPQELTSLLTIDLDTKIPYDTDDQHKLDWEDMRALLPEHCPQPEPMDKSPLHKG